MRSIVSILLVMFFICVSATPHACAVPSLLVEKDYFEIAYDERELQNLLNLDLPLNLTVMDSEIPMSSYQLGVTLVKPFSETQNFGIQLKLPFDSVAEGAFSYQSLFPEAGEIIFYQNIQPTFNMQPFLILMDALIPEGALAGTYTARLQFNLYSLDTILESYLESEVEALQTEVGSPLMGGTLVDQFEVTLSVTVAEILTLEVSFGEVGEDADSNPLNYLNFGLIDPEIKREDKKVSVRIKTNLGREYRLFQRRGEEMHSEIYHLPFAENGIYFEVDDSTLNGRAYYNQPEPLQIEDDLIYESDDLGSSDFIPVIYSIQNMEALKAGRYASILTYFIEPVVPADNFPEIKTTFDVFVEVKTQFYFYVTPENEALSLEFDPLEDPSHFQDQIVRVEILSNLGRPYQFSHALPNGLVNEDGLIYPPEHFLYVLSNEQGIPVSPNEFSMISDSDQLIFQSDEQGNSDFFFVTYRAEGAAQQISGKYRTDLQFTCSTD